MVVDTKLDKLYTHVNKNSDSAISLDKNKGSSRELHSKSGSDKQQTFEA